MKKVYSSLATLLTLGGMSAIVSGIYLLSPPVAMIIAGAFLLFIALLFERLSRKAGKR